MAIHEAYAIAIGAQHLLDGRLRAKTERTLEIGELHELDRRVRRAFGGRLRVRQRLPRRLERETHWCLLFQLLEVSLACGLRPLLRQVRTKRLPHLIERRPLHARLVRLLPRG